MSKTQPRRPAAQDTRSQADIAREALAMKQEAEKQGEEKQGEEKKTPHFEERTADGGMRSDPHEEQAPSGALDHAGQLPAMQRSKFAR
jgi:hypothetical protein